MHAHVYGSGNLKQLKMSEVILLTFLQNSCAGTWMVAILMATTGKGALFMRLVWTEASLLQGVGQCTRAILELHIRFN